MSPHLGDHRARARAHVKTVGAVARDLAQQGGIGRVANHRAGRLGRTVFIEIQHARLGIALEVHIHRQPARQLLADRITVGGEPDRRPEQHAPRQPPVLLVRHFGHPEDARHADRAAAHQCFAKRHRLAAFSHEQAVTDRGGGGFAAVVCLDDRGARIVVEQEGATADTGGMRFDQAQHQLHRDRGIDCAAATLEHLEARRAGQRVGGRDHVARSAGSRLLHEHAANRKLSDTQRLRRRAAGCEEEKHCHQSHTVDSRWVGAVKRYRCVRRCCKRGRGGALPPPARGLFRRHSNRAVEADRLAIEHRVLDDVARQRGILVRMSQPRRERHLLAQGILGFLRQAHQ